jgi:hypothetical protein
LKKRTRTGLNKIKEYLLNNSTHADIVQENREFYNYFSMDVDCENYSQLVEKNTPMYCKSPPGTEKKHATLVHHLVII